MKPYDLRSDERKSLAFGETLTGSGVAAGDPKNTAAFN